MSESAVSSSILERLRDVPMLAGLADDELTALATAMRFRTVRAGETLVTEGAVGDEMYTLVRGQVRVSKHTLDNDEYTVVVQDELGTPIFGELALLDEERRSASIVAVRDCELLVLSRVAFEQFGNAQPRAGLIIMRHLAKGLSGNLRRANEDALLLFEALVNEVRSKTAV